MDKDGDAIRALQHRALRALEPWLSEGKTTAHTRPPISVIASV